MAHGNGIDTDRLTQMAVRRRHAADNHWAERCAVSEPACSCRYSSSRQQHGLVCA